LIPNMPAPVPRRTMLVPRIVTRRFHPAQQLIPGLVSTQEDTAIRHQRAHAALLVNHHTSLADHRYLSGQVVAFGVKEKLDFPQMLEGIRNTQCRLLVCTIVMVRRSEEHTSELQSRENLVCRLLLEKKKKNI